MAKRAKKSPSDSPNAGLDEALREMDFRIARKSEKGAVDYSIGGALSSVRQLIERLKLERENPSGVFRESVPGYTVTDTDSACAFTGGSFPDLEKRLAGDFDLTPFLEARANLAESGIERKIRTRIAELFPKRRRVMSEYDGEWDYDRRWEIAPFQATERQASQGRTMDIVCDFSISASTEASEICKYGATAWAIADLIESAGVSASITLQVRAARIARSSKNVSLDLKIEAKRAGEYAAPSLLASVFHPLFYRRPLFSLIAMSAHLENCAERYGLGSCAPLTRERITHQDGKLIVTPGIYMAPEHDIEREILAAIGAAKPEGMAA